MSGIEPPRPRPQVRIGRRGIGKLGKPIVLVGMMGAGKTAVGRALAARLRVPFHDCDVEIESAANMTIAEIFARDGEAFFRRKESQVLGRLLDGPPGILSTGGGVFVSEDNRAAVRDRGVSVWLNVPVDVLWARVRNRTTRPLLSTANPRATLQEILDRRMPQYAEADVEVHADAKTGIEDMVDRILTALIDRGDVFGAKS
ncbi:shikimate kinase [Chachezhania antarctica]|uniref:shikimate kinase n=1 Tax=Chachezhania antarctica TaxID=2340860 RepID=UPI000EAC09BA|nr:shikimate kinase [Chachezhania antarctica]|tara:strand:- start:431 stop:1033 length:603 start_codon:yes stop_codon:yes gene_type:complete